ncbi:hypothetical protein QLX08_004344 [Tetragonisca angustula]|uniref:Uncharacterized protein n=1 Tax=Tetragonisca angustula TaxID=166442 RepID=A0AAW1A2T1_9HYME
MEGEMGRRYLWRLDEAPHFKTGEVDYVWATGIGHPSNPNPDRLWMLQNTSLPNWLDGISPVSALWRARG